MLTILGCVASTTARGVDRATVLVLSSARVAYRSEAEAIKSMLDSDIDVVWTTPGPEGYNPAVLRSHSISLAASETLHRIRPLASARVRSYRSASASAMSIATSHVRVSRIAGVRRLRSRR